MSTVWQKKINDRSCLFEDIAELPDACVGIGSCTKNKDNGKIRILKGCPPSRDAIIEFLRCL